MISTIRVPRPLPSGGGGFPQGPLPLVNPNYYGDQQLVSKSPFPFVSPSWRANPPQPIREPEPPPLLPPTSPALDGAIPPAPPASNLAGLRQWLDRIFGWSPGGPYHPPQNEILPGTGAN